MSTGETSATHDGRYEIGEPGRRTVVEIIGGRPHITRLAGWTTGGRPDLVPPPSAGIATICANGRRPSADDLRVTGLEASAQAITIRLDVGSSGLSLETTLVAHEATGVLSRTDTVTNDGHEPVILSRALARLPLGRGRYELYTQESRWSHENQGSWSRLSTGSVSLDHLPGRPTEGATPYIAIRRAGEGDALAAHLLPRGNYTIRASAVPAMGDLPFGLLEMGLSDRDLRLPLASGSRVTVARLLYQYLPSGEPHSAAPELHRYLLGTTLPPPKSPPVVYNTWFDQFDRLEVPRLREQLAAAKEVGCEVFVIDAGWFGKGEASWSSLTGHWDENPDAAFRGNMSAFADEVRSAGLGFGLWIEPERIGAEAPVRAVHPDWFIPVGEVARVDLARPAARAWVKSEIGRLVTTYRLAWMKIDFNFSLGHDDTGSELTQYYEQWYRLMDEVRSEHPHTFFEGCASGGMRLDLESLAHCDAHFLSDTVNPVDTIRIGEGAWLRLPPGRLSRWCVVRSAGPAVPRYGLRMADAPQMVVVPRGALWEPAESVDLEFALAAALPGVFGLSGDPASLAPPERAVAASAVGYYKRHREAIGRSVGHLLTPPRLLSSREGWAAVQLDAGALHIVIVYRMGDCGSPPAIRPRGLDPDAAYTVACGFDEVQTDERTTGAELAEGLPVAPRMPAAHHGRSALVYTISANRSVAPQRPGGSH